MLNVTVVKNGDGTASVELDFSEKGAKKSSTGTTKILGTQQVVIDGRYKAQVMLRTMSDKERRFLGL